MASYHITVVADRSEYCLVHHCFEIMLVISLWLYLIIERIKKETQVDYISNLFTYFDNLYYNWLTL